MTTLPTKEALKFGWKTTKERFFFLLGLFVLYVVVQNVFTNIVDNLPENTGVLFLVVGIVGTIAQAAVGMGIMNIVLRLVRGEEASFSHLFAQNNLVIPYCVASVIVGVAAAIGTLLLIVPGIIIALTFMFYGYVMIDKKMGIKESLIESMRMTKGVRWSLLRFVLVLFLVNVLGAMLVGIGLLWTIPTTSIALAYMYNFLASRSAIEIAPEASLVKGQA